MTNTTHPESEMLAIHSPDRALQDLLGQSEHYQATVLEYCLLAPQPTLRDAQQDRIAESLQQGIDDPVWNFGLEEGDHLVANHWGLIDNDFIIHQQDKFRRAIGEGQMGNLWRDLQSRTKVLQAYLQRQGVYQGAIDGIMGPLTQEAMRLLNEQQPHALTELGFA